MHNKISREARAEVLGALRERYQQAPKQDTGSSSLFLNRT